MRLQRVGRKNIPVFRVVLTDSKNSTKSGRYLEVLGIYDPINDVKEVKVDRITHWISKGAKPSDTLHNFLVAQKIVPGKKVNALPRKRPIKKEEKGSETAPAASTPVEKTPETPAEGVKEEAKAAVA